MSRYNRHWHQSIYAFLCCLAHSKTSACATHRAFAKWQPVITCTYHILASRLTATISPHDLNRIEWNLKVMHACFKWNLPSECCWTSFWSDHINVHSVAVELKVSVLSVLRVLFAFVEWNFIETKIERKLQHIDMQVSTKAWRSKKKSLGRNIEIFKHWITRKRVSVLFCFEYDGWI